MYLRILVVLCGAAVMVLEIIASRFFAPYIGTSVLVWTSLIGVVMTGLSAGYWLGGNIGDANRTIEGLRHIILMAGLWIVGLALVRDPVLSTLSSSAPHVATAVLGAFILLFIPSLLLGMVTPYAVRLAASDIVHVGRTAGSLSALSTIGSIAGTFLAGFALVPSFGTTAILFLTSAVLIVLSTFRLQTRSLLICISFLALVFFAAAMERTLRSAANAQQGIVYEADSPYGAIRVREASASGPLWWNGLLLQIDANMHAAISSEDENAHVFNYTAYYALGGALRPDVRDALLIGGGGYTVARDFLRRHENARLSVVEIDPDVTRVAREYFRLRDVPRLAIYHEDGRMYLNRLGPPGVAGAAAGKYQIVFGDVFRSDISVPFHLTTREAMENIFALLDKRGVFVMNVIGTTDQPTGFLAAEITTLRSVFPSVLAFAIPDHEGTLRPPDVRQNVILLASKTPITPEDVKNAAANDPRLSAMAATMIDIPVSDAKLLTDDYAPVEALIHLR